MMLKYSSLMSIIGFFVFGGSHSRDFLESSMKGSTGIKAGFDGNSSEGEVTVSILPEEPFEFFYPEIVYVVKKILI